MEEGLNSKIINEFQLKRNDIRTYSPLSLAYIGDSIFDVIIRSIVVDAGNTSVNKLHASSTRYVSAKAQNKMILAIIDELNDEEKDIFRRGKNTKMKTVAKNATLEEYRNATGFEAVLGYLYLKDETDRLFFLIKKGIAVIDERSK